MTRIGWLLTGLLGVLLAVLWFFLLYSPTSDEIAEVRDQTELTLTRAADQRARAAELRAVREGAPEAEAALNVGRLLVPDDPAIPALFRQLQQAADDSGVRLVSINPTQPNVMEVADDREIAVIGVTMSLEGSYFQVVDLARRIEDPELTPRALRWNAASLTPSDFPILNVTLSGDVFSRSVADLPTVEEEPVEDDEADGTDEQENDTDPDSEAASEVSP